MGIFLIERTLKLNGWRKAELTWSTFAEESPDDFLNVK